MPTAANEDQLECKLALANKATLVIMAASNSKFSTLGRGQRGEHNGFNEVEIYKYSK